jgi:hypothetical protein
MTSSTAEKEQRRPDITCGQVVKSASEPLGKLR